MVMVETEYAWGRLKSEFKSACQRIGGEFYEGSGFVECVHRKGEDYQAIRLGYAPRKKVLVLAETKGSEAVLEAPDPGEVRVEGDEDRLVVKILTDLYAPTVEINKAVKLKPLCVKVEHMLKEGSLFDALRRPT